MIILMKRESSDEQLQQVLHMLSENELRAKVINENTKKLIYVSGDLKKLKMNIRMMPGVERYIDLSVQKRITEICKDKKRDLLKIDNEEIGGRKLTMIAGPCSVEGYEQILETAKFISATGGKFLRGGAYKPRTSPYSFQGTGLEGLKILRSVAKETGLKCVSEVTSEKYLDSCMKYCDVLQVGTRNMQNFELLREIGKTKFPVILKRGYASTVEEWLNAAEYIVYGGNENVILCERGIRTFENSTRYTLDISAIPVIKKKCSLPIIVDPSHAAGHTEYVKSLALAAVAAGADGLMVEVHPNAKFALSDCFQQLNFEQYEDLCIGVKSIARAVKREI